MNEQIYVQNIEDSGLNFANSMGSLSHRYPFSTVYIHEIMDFLDKEDLADNNIKRINFNVRDGVMDLPVDNISLVADYLIENRMFQSLQEFHIKYSVDHEDLTLLTEKIFNFIEERAGIHTLSVLFKMLYEAPSQLLENFLNQNGRIKTLTFESNYMIDPHCFDRLEKLSLNVKDVTNDAEGEYLNAFINDFASVIENHQYLQSLKIMIANDYFLDKIINAVGSNKTILTLDLAGINNIGVNVYVSIKEMLQTNNTLTLLIMCQFDNFEYIIEGLRDNESIKYIVLNVCRESGAALRSQKFLEQLDELLDTNFTLIDYQINTKVFDNILRQKIAEKLRRNGKILKNKRFRNTKPL